MRYRFWILGIFLSTILFGVASADFDFNLTYSFGDVFFDTLNGYDVIQMENCDKINDLGRPWLPKSSHTFIIAADCVYFVAGIGAYYSIYTKAVLLK